MTRKKFVKLCMSYGMSRNNASKYASLIRKRGEAYEVGIQHLAACENLSKAMKLTADNLRMFGATVQHVTEALKQFLREIKSVSGRL